MNIDTLKKIARRNDQQILYNRAKELSCIELFENKKNLSKIQIFFLYFLQMYDNLFQDLQSGAKYISEEIINDSLRCEAYLLYKKEQRINKIDEMQTQTNSEHGEGSIIFRKGKKK